MDVGKLQDLFLVLWHFDSLWFDGVAYFRVVVEEVFICEGMETSVAEKMLDFVFGYL